ncbi:MAG TPA: hypothetical protein VNX68_05855 [Nitrosopumilaceae archaeon]|nr:hypothetical protein [Nitrosopumilaceae archaeon]
MIFYSSEEADFLINYYADKVVGKILESSTQTQVTSLAKEPIDKNKYRVFGIGTMVQGVFTPTKSISAIAKDLNLLAPEEVLKNRN